MKIDSKEYSDWFTVDGEEYDDIVIMQSTGLRDKNGVEIFQGDIIRVVSRSTGITNHVVSLQGLHYTGVDSNNKSWSLEQILESTYTLKYEVIGNKYENPKLVN